MNLLLPCPVLKTTDLGTEYHPCVRAPLPAPVDAAPQCVSHLRHQIVDSGREQTALCRGDTSYTDALGRQARVGGQSVPLPREQNPETHGEPPAQLGQEGLGHVTVMEIRKQPEDHSPSIS